MTETMEESSEGDTSGEPDDLVAEDVAMEAHQA